MHITTFYIIYGKYFFVNRKTENKRKLLSVSFYFLIFFGVMPSSSSSLPVERSKISARTIVIAKQVADAIVSGECERGILCCGTGVGISIAANKVKGIRCACCSDCFSAHYTRLHNDANILAMGGRVIGAGLACMMVDTFLETEFEGGRHARRVGLITEIEENN